MHMLHAELFSCFLSRELRLAPLTEKRDMFEEIEVTDLEVAQDLLAAGEPTSAIWEELLELAAEYGVAGPEFAFDSPESTTQWGWKGPHVVDATGPESAWVRTYTGGRFYPLAPRVEDVRLYDIAAALSCINRFTGHAPGSVSVGAHSLRVASYVPEQYRLAALLHDAAEAYLNDIASPVKAHSVLRTASGLRDFRDHESVVLNVIFEGLGLSTENRARVDSAEVRAADQAAFEDECRRFIGVGEVVFATAEHTPDPRDVRDAFIRAFYAYGGGR